MRLVLCNCPPDVADKIAHQVLEKGLAACVNTVPKVRRTLRQEDELCVREETMLLIQTLDSQFDKLFDTLVEIHPFEPPAIISLTISGGNGSYMKWIGDKLEEKT